MVDVGGAVPSKFADFIAKKQAYGMLKNPAKFVDDPKCFEAAARDSY